MFDVFFIQPLSSQLGDYMLPTTSVLREPGNSIEDSRVFNDHAKCMSIENMGHYMMNIDESQGDIIIFFGLNSDLFLK